MISGVLYAPAGGADVGINFCRAFAGARVPGDAAVNGTLSGAGPDRPAAGVARTRAFAPAEPERLVDRAGPDDDGNLIYYVCLASAIQRTGAPVSTMIIGTLPVVLPVFANLLYSQRDGKLPWRRLFPALVCIAVGLICVNVAETAPGAA